ncbi:hypothetical protein AGMMS49982_14080 [Bacteroidia bacterium]|nr:hypothetical protein AGMMS49982_14080 [Bacteroidia bacterium]
MKNRCLVLCITTLALVACEEKVLGPTDSSHGKPGVVTEVTVNRLPGGADIFYRIPDSEDLLAIKAVYTTTNGTKREASAFYYDNHLVLEGFADTLLHEAQLYAVNRAQELSDPVTVPFQPLESPLNKTVKSVKIEPDFGGAAFSWSNKDTTTLTFEILTPDSNGKMQTASIFTSNKDTVNYIIHGYAAEPRQFGLVVSDNFGNASDMITSPEGFTPLQEDKLDKKLMSLVHLNPGDSWLDGWGFLEESLLDDDVSTIMHSRPNSMPVRYTIDLGKKAQLSRLVVHNRLIGTYYENGNPIYFDVFRNIPETISQSAIASEWQKIATFTEIKPSGLAGIECTSADNRVAARGFSFDFPRDMPPTRYLRFDHPSTAATWQNKNFVHIAEFTFFGTYDE